MKENVPEKLDGKPSISQDADFPTFQTADLAAENLKSCYSKAFPSAPNPEIPYSMQENKIAITLENQESLPEASRFAGRELVHLEPPNIIFGDEPLNQTQADQGEDVKDCTEIRKSYLSEKTPSALENFPVPSVNHQPQRSCISCTNQLAPSSLTDNRIVKQSPLTFPDTRVKNLLKAKDENLPCTACEFQEKENSALLILETTQRSSLPKLRQVALKDSITKKNSWMGLPLRQPNGSPPFFIKGLRTPVSPMTQQQKLMTRNLRELKEKSKGFLKRDTIRMNFAHLKQMPRMTGTNLPILSPPFQTRSGKNI